MRNLFTMVLLVLGVHALSARDMPPILPLAEIEPGMEGEFRTVIEGSEIESYPIRIVGVVENFIGPQRPVIWAEALDEDNQLYGPVSGMSGSPVFIDGKLIGAYAYGYRFPKDQALIGIQPIESMLEISSMHPPRKPALGRPRPSPLDQDARMGMLSSDGLPANGGEPALTSPEQWDWKEGRLPHHYKDSQGEVDQFRSLPIPIMLGGFGSKTLSVFQPHFDALGLDVMQAPVGSATQSELGEMEPGSPVAGVLMSGDFNAAGVGTVTFRDGDRIMAFGHPFFQYGPTEIPMAQAEVVTIVQSVASSFKLSSIGPVVGSIYQDRLTGIAGAIGRMAPVTHIDVSIKAPGGVVRKYSGNLFQHRQLSPLLASMAMMESLFSTLEAESEQTIYSAIEIKLKDGEPIRFQDVASGRDGPMRIIMDFLSIYTGLMNNPFRFPEVESVRFDFDLKDTWDQQVLEQVVVENGEATAGESLDLQIIMHDYMGEPVHRSISIPIPEGTEGEVLEVEIMDASRANPGWNTQAGGSRYTPRPDARNLDDLLEELRGRRGFQAVYVKLYRPGEGVRMRGTDLEGLPPSYMASIASPKTAEVMKRSGRILVWEGAYPTKGEFRGHYRFRVEVKN